MKQYVRNRTHAGPQRLYFADHPDFTPNMTPEMMFVHGVFGGTYWREITSGVTGQTYKEQWKEFPDLARFADSEPHMRDFLESKVYDVTKNKYGVLAGSPLERKNGVYTGSCLKEWEKHGWIHSQDPYGWVQWYCRFYAGRRTPDDERQIRRWQNMAGPNGRFRKQLINKIREFNTTYWDISVSPIIRQTLLHWGYELTEADFKAYVASKTEDK